MMPQTTLILFLSRALPWITLLSVLTLGSCSTQPTPASEAEPTLPLEDCQLLTASMTFGVDAKCGTLTVYENPATQSGRQIELSIAVLPAVSRTPAPDALFLLAGGPGQAAIETYAPWSAR